MCQNWSNKKKHIEPSDFLKDCTEIFKDKINKTLKEKYNVQVYIVLVAKYSKFKNDVISDEIKSFYTKTFSIVLSDY